jgi:protein-tyrosine phosphatase
MKILMVCLGNICRSPLAHGLLQNKIDTLGLDWEVDSAGTGGWHAGEMPDRRAIEAAKKHGIDITNQKARQIKVSDFEQFDLILTMDAQNYRDVNSLVTLPEHKSKVKMIMNYVSFRKNIQVPDPYYDNRFDLVYNMLDEAIDALIKSVAADVLVK